MAEIANGYAVDARRQLGAALREARLSAGRTTRQVDGFSTAHVSRVENGHVQPSRDFIAAYVAMGASPGRLYSLWDRSRLVTGRRTAAPTDDSVGAEQDLARGLSDAHADPLVLRRGYTVESIEGIYFMDERRRLSRIEHRAIIRATHPAARYFPFRHAYEEDPRPGVSTVTPGGGCTIPVLDEGPSGTIYAVLGFDQNSRDTSGAYELTWSIGITSEVPPRPLVVGGTMAPLPQVATTVQFTPPALPRCVWWYRDFDKNAGTMKPNPERMITAGDSHCYRREWHHLDREWWGLAWSWSEDLKVSLPG